MKKGKLLSIIAENVEKTYLTNMNEDSFYDGHKFVDYGKNIENVNAGELSIDKDKLVIHWGAKFLFRNTGVEGVEVNVLDMTADAIVSGKTITINFAEYQFNVIKEKNPEDKDFNMFVTAIEIDANEKIVTVTVSI